MRHPALALVLTVLLVLAPALVVGSDVYAQMPTGAAVEGLHQAIADGFTEVEDEGGPLTSGKAVQGSVYPADDTDVYTIDGRSNQWITIDILGQFGLQPMVEVYYPNGSLFTSAHGGTQVTKTTRLMATGAHTVVVRSYVYPSKTIGDYSLKVTVSDRAP